MYNTGPTYLMSIPEQHKCVYGIHNNHDHIDEGDRVKGDRGCEKGERDGRKKRGGRKEKEDGRKVEKK